jgi:hypothetical protein
MESGDVEIWRGLLVIDIVLYLPMYNVILRSSACVLL